MDMKKSNSEQAYLSAIDLIEEQLRVLPISIATILKPLELNSDDMNAVADLTWLQRRHKQAKTGSGGNIVADCAHPDTSFDLHASNQALRENPQLKTHYLRVVISNALLAVGLYMKEHDMAAMRTPEIQFLHHVIDAILNSNRFKIEAGYIPIATFDGLVIDSSVNGALLFGDGTTEGFMEFGDAIALLQWLSRYLRGEKRFVSGGDAG
jgi:hypothetical protein